MANVKTTPAFLSEYVSEQSAMKKKRLVGIVMMALFLLLPILVVWFNGWMEQLGAGVGVRWLLAGIITVILTIAVPIVDIAYRGWL